MQNKNLALAFLCLCGWTQAEENPQQWSVRVNPISLFLNINSAGNYFYKIEVENAAPDHSWSGFASIFHQPKYEPFAPFEGKSCGFGLEKPFSKGRGLVSHSYYRFSNEYTYLSEYHLDEIPYSSQEVRHDYLAIEGLAYLGYQLKLSPFSLRTEAALGFAAIEQIKPSYKTLLRPSGNFNFSLGYHF